MSRESYMVIIEQNGDYMLVESVGEYMEIRYEVLSKYYFYNASCEKVESYKLDGWSHDLKNARAIYMKRIQQKSKKKVFCPQMVDFIF